MGRIIAQTTALLVWTYALGTIALAPHMMGYIAALGQMACALVAAIAISWLIFKK